MANISKQGVVTATSRANPNLLSRYVVPGQNGPTSTATSGRTRYYGNYGIIIPCQESGDTYFRVFLTERLVQGTLYTISCYASGVLDGTYYNFPLFKQDNGNMGLLQINHNGLCCVTFTMTWTGTQSATTAGSETVYICLMDDITRNIASGQGAITLTNFKIEQGSVPTPWVPASTDPIYVADHSNMFEIDDICKIHKNGNIQAFEFIEI